MGPVLSWAPKRDVFLRRSLMLGMATFAILAGVGLIASSLLELPLAWVLPVGALLTLGFLVDDILRWRTYKFDRWQISDGHLLHEDRDGSVSIPLGDIRKVMTRIGNRVVVELASGQRITLRYLPFPTETAEQIRDRLPRPV
ncbi:hypothetical protein SAMN04488523_101354 [Sulfitobacter brevis]|uniref:PH domain-containing protein n=1 Tax=Sulfitobacter brevis TaxID=74348 RepID=A0A1I1THF1_9RHOB|nr:hypothetical protein [Sulfitobacter brevis]SFD56578.1 hypothetical protein SAMN04488523_101354 [Sulfitobacter brevis]